VISFNSQKKNKKKMGLCSDSTSYYRVFGSCLDFSLSPVSALVGVNSFSSNQDRLGS